MTRAFDAAGAPAPERDAHRALTALVAQRILDAGDASVTPLPDTFRHAPEVPEAVRTRVHARLIAPFTFTPDETAPGPAVTPETLASAHRTAAGVRRRGGVYYTPRALAARIVRLALLHHVTGRLGWTPEDARSRGVAEALGALAPLTAQRSPPSLPPADADAAARTLADVTVCDPACGSGAFLVAAADAIADARRALTALAGAPAPDVAALKRHAVAHQIRGVDVDAEAVDVARLRLTLAAGGADARGLRVGDALLDPRGERVDVVVGNPPYVRHQAVRDLVGGSGARAYKARLDALFEARTGIRPAPRADLLVHFFAAALDLVRPGGVVALLASNAWLDAAYGAPLREHVVTRATLLASVDARNGRAFTDADVHATVTLLRRAPPPPDHEAAFVTADAPLADALTADASATRVRPADLAPAIPWGALLHRCPPRWSTWALRVLRDVPPLDAHTRVSAYLSTRGADDFFFGHRVRGDGENVVVAFADGSRFTLPRAHVHPVVRSPRTVRRLGLSHADCGDACVVTLPCDADALTPAERAYVAWGESRGFHARSNRRQARPWWRPPDVDAARAPVLVGCRYATAFHAYRNPDGLVANRFHRVHAADPDVVFAMLNAAPARFFAQLVANARLGLGVLDLARGDVARLPVPAPGALTEEDARTLRDAATALMDEDPRGAAASKARELVDATLAPYYELAPGDVPALEDATQALVDARLAKAKRHGAAR